MPGRKCPLISCGEVFATGKGKRRHVYNNGHGTVVHCSSCNEPFLTDGAREQHMKSMGPHSEPPKERGRTKTDTLSDNQSSEDNQLHSTLSLIGESGESASNVTMMPKSNKLTLSHLNSKLGSARITYHSEFSAQALNSSGPSLSIHKGGGGPSRHAERSRNKKRGKPSISTGNAQQQNIGKGLSMMTMFSAGIPQLQDIRKGVSMMPTAKKVTVPTEPQRSLYSVSSNSELNSFIANEIQPNSLFLDSSSAAVDKMVTFLQNNMPEKFRPSRVIKGGSLGKGTAVKGKSDIDLTLVVGGIGDIQTLKDKLPDILDNLEVYLGRYSGAEVIKKTTHAVQVEVTAHGETHSVDILPSLDVNVHDSTSLRDIYQGMSRESTRVRQFYSTSLSPLQLEIIKQMPTKLKSLIRLVKYWKKSETTSEKVPTSFVMELVVIHAWQSQGSPTDFNMVNALKDVLTHLTQHRSFKVEFGKLRKYSDGMAQTRYGPYIIDPTNPFNDVYHGHFGKSWDWDDVSREASEWLNKPLFGGARREWN